MSHSPAVSAAARGAAEKADLVAFMKSLTGSTQVASQPQLPQ